VVFKKKKPHENKSLADKQEEENFQWSFKEDIKDIQRKELFGANKKDSN
jgi:hypothetical protein